MLAVFGWMPGFGEGKSQAAFCPTSQKPRDDDWRMWGESVAYILAGVTADQLGTFIPYDQRRFPFSYQF